MFDFNRFRLYENATQSCTSCFIILADFKVASKWSSGHFFFLQPNFAEILGVPESKASLLIGYLSIASTVSRVLFGLVLNHPRVNRFYVLQVCKEMFSLTNM